MGKKSDKFLEFFLKVGVESWSEYAALRKLDRPSLSAVINQGKGVYRHGKTGKVKRALEKDGFYQQPTR